MRIFFTALTFLLLSCSTQEQSKDEDSKMIVTDTPSLVITTSPTADTLQALKVHSNQRFKNVIVKKIGPDKFNLTGEGQIFEASFNWVVEDGHNELKSGYTTTDAGAPEWGKFNFTLTIPKSRPNSVLTIILFEASAQDGRRTHELPITLPE